VKIHDWKWLRITFIEIVEVAKGGTVGRWEGEWGSSDPLWVVRGRKM
jgi:hypothetical protein